VGGKNASLGEMVRSLGPHGIKVPPGFAITADSYRHFISANKLERLIESQLASLRTSEGSVAAIGSAIRSAIEESEWPDDLAEAICQAYRDGKAYPNRGWSCDSRFDPSSLMDHGAHFEALPFTYSPISNAVG
jgi:phosphoenolpyruvate synthase/pyruvate phosphate dikinase